jgi:hypothetical protein
VPTLETGEIDYDSLEASLRDNKDRPAIINVNIGTTVKVGPLPQAQGAARERWPRSRRAGVWGGRWRSSAARRWPGSRACSPLPFVTAHPFVPPPHRPFAPHPQGAVDDLDRVLDILKATGYTQDRFYIHCDGALFGMMMPFLKQAPMVTFRKPIGSVSVSGHKFLGAPVPCGVVITRFRHVLALSSDVEYLNSRDATIMGSRNGHAPIYLVGRGEGAGAGAPGLGAAARTTAEPAPAAACVRKPSCVLGQCLPGAQSPAPTHAPIHAHPSQRPALQWYTLTRKGYAGIAKDVEACMRNAHVLKNMLEQAGIKTMLNELSNTVGEGAPDAGIAAAGGRAVSWHRERPCVANRECLLLPQAQPALQRPSAASFPPPPPQVVFERPREEAFVRKWQLACEGDIAHVVVMPNITLDILRSFVEELISSRARMSIAAARAVLDKARAAEHSDSGSEPTA